jgi:hypothetical protein
LVATTTQQLFVAACADITLLVKHAWCVCMALAESTEQLRLVVILGHVDGNRLLGGILLCCSSMIAICWRCLLLCCCTSIDCRSLCPL